MKSSSDQIDKLKKGLVAFQGISNQLKQEINSLKVGGASAGEGTASAAGVDAVVSDVFTQPLASF